MFCYSLLLHLFCSLCFGELSSDYVIGLLFGAVVVVAVFVLGVSIADAYLICFFCLPAIVFVVVLDLLKSDCVGSAHAVMTD